MKKFLLGSIAFFLFSISISILQTSCDKDADAAPETNNGVTQLNKIFYGKLEGNKVEYWMANYDGSGQTKINLSMPNGYNNSNTAFISPDAQKIFFIANKTTSNSWEEYIFSCNIDGTDVRQVMFLGDQDWNRFIGVY